MSDNHILVKSEVSKPDVEAVHELLARVMDEGNVTRDIAIVALLSLAIMILHPEIDPQDLGPTTYSTS